MARGSNSVVETYEILGQINADRRRAELGMWTSIAKMERRERFWQGVGLVVTGILIMLGNRERD